MTNELRALRFAAKFYSQQLFRCQQAYDYAFKRVPDKDTLEKFELGLSGSYNELSKYVQEKLPDKLIYFMDSGLIRYSSKGTYYDTFRERIMFPIKDEEGDVVGFSSRTFLPDDDNPKYINSSNNNNFRKGELLYNMHQAKDYIKDRNFVYLVEGFFDVTTMHLFNKENTVALMGTHLTYDHIMLIRQYTNNVFLLFDNDDAGRRMMYNAINMFHKYNMNVATGVMPEGDDPDTYVMKTRDKNHILPHKNAYELLFDNEMKKLQETNNTARKAQYVLEVIPNILKDAPDRYKYELLFKMMGLEGIDPYVLMEDYRVMYPGVFDYTKYLNKFKNKGGH